MRRHRCRGHQERVQVSSSTGSSVVVWCPVVVLLIDILTGRASSILIGWGRVGHPHDSENGTAAALTKLQNLFCRCFRHLDCAADYGNEKEVGAGIKAAIAAGLVKREVRRVALATSCLGGRSRGDPFSRLADPMLGISSSTAVSPRNPSSNINFSSHPLLHLSILPGFVHHD